MFILYQGDFSMDCKSEAGHRGRTDLSLGPDLGPFNQVTEVEGSKRDSDDRFSLNCRTISRGFFGSMMLHQYEEVGERCDLYLPLGSIRHRSIYNLSIFIPKT